MLQSSQGANLAEEHTKLKEEFSKLKQYAQTLLQDKEELRAKISTLERELDKLRFSSITTIHASAPASQNAPLSPKRQVEVKTQKSSGKPEGLSESSKPIASGCQAAVSQAPVQSTKPAVAQASSSNTPLRNVHQPGQILDSIKVPRSQSKPNAILAPSRKRSRSPEARNTKRARIRSTSLLSNLTEVESNDEDAEAEGLLDSQKTFPNVPAKADVAGVAGPSSPKALDPLFSDKQDTNTAALIPGPSQNKEHLVQNAKALYALLVATLTALRVNPEPNLAEIPRKFFTDVYGAQGATFVAFIKVAAGKNSAFKDTAKMMFPSPDLNPHTPQEPGQPGLIFSSRTDILGPSTALFARYPSATKVVWRYMGHYRSWVEGQITGQSFRVQAKKIKDSWCKKILDSKKWDKYTSMRGIVALQKKFPEKKSFSETEIRAAADTTSTKNRSNQVTVRDIENALEAGIIGIDVVKMQCVHYDHEFMGLLAVDLKAYGPQAKDSSQTVKTSQQKGHTRKRSTSPSPGPSSSDEAEPPRRAGTRVRRQTSRALGHIDLTEDDGGEYEPGA